MKTVAIIQGRMNSRRLPGKILSDVAGSPLISHVIRRAEASGVFHDVVLATTADRSDDPVEEFCVSRGIHFFRGDTDDVLRRYAETARSCGAELIARLTGDCPLLDPDVIRRVVESFDPARHDYVSNALRRTYPDGLDTEVFTMSALAAAEKRAVLPSEREHVTPYLHKHPELFRIGHVTQERDLSDLRWTVDEARDLDFVREVFRELEDGVFGQDDILALLKRRPNLQKLNEGIQCNEGYLRSLREDEVSGSKA